jgi:hypothetical protein
MVYLLVVLLVIGLSVWLWGEDTVKAVIKWLLAIAVIGIIVVIIKENNEKNKEEETEQQKNACYERYEKAKEEARNKLPECARYIVTYEDEKNNKCRINWDLQNDEGIKAKDTYESDKSLDDVADSVQACEDKQ